MILPATIETLIQEWREREAVYRRLSDDVETDELSAHAFDCMAADRKECADELSAALRDARETPETPRTCEQCQHRGPISLSGKDRVCVAMERFVPLTLKGQPFSCAAFTPQDQV